MGIPASTFFRELTEGLTLFFSIIEIVLLVTPARLASARGDRPLSLRMVFRRGPTAKVGILRAIQMGQMERISARLRSIFNASPRRAPLSPGSAGAPGSGCRTAGRKWSRRTGPPPRHPAPRPTAAHGYPGHCPADR